MASDGDRLRAERLYVEAGEAVPAIAATIGVNRRTVQRWASAGDWEVRRVAFCRTLSRNVAADAVVEARITTSALSRAEGLAIAAAIALSDEEDARDRLAAIKLAATIEGWAEEGLGGSASAQGKADVPRGVIELPAFDTEPVPPPDEPEAGGAP